MYELCCPACNDNYIGKTDQNFSTSVQKHRDPDKNSPIYKHLLECKHFNNVVNLHNLPPSNKSVKYLEHVQIAVYGNNRIIDNCQNWVKSCSLESLHTKWKKSKLNCSI